MKFLFLITLMAFCTATGNGFAQTTAPSIDARAILSSVIEQFNSAQRIAAEYRYTTLSLPETNEVDPLVAGTWSSTDCKLFLVRPNRLDVRGSSMSADSRFMCDGENVYRIGPGPHGVVIQEVPMTAVDIDGLVTGRYLAHVWLQQQFVWLLRTDAWKHYFQYAENLRHVGWVRSSDFRIKPRLARVCFDMWDDSSWELWVDPANENALQRVSIRSFSSTGFYDLKDGAAREGVIDDENIKRRLTVQMRVDHVFDFTSVRFDGTMTEDAFAAPDGERQEVNEMPVPPNNVGQACPEELGKSADGTNVSLANFEGQPFVAIDLRTPSIQKPNGSLLRHSARIATAMLGDPKAVVVFTEATPDKSIKTLLQSDEFRGCTIITSPSADANETLFHYARSPIIGRDGRVVWEGNARYPLGMPAFTDALEQAMAK